MGKKRKTREEKLRSTKRSENQLSFKIKDGWLTKNDKSIILGTQASINNSIFFKADLTKTLFLTMLVLAVELALWQILSRQ